MDNLPEGSATLFPPRGRLPLQRASGHVCVVVRQWLGRDGVLWGLYLSVVSLGGIGTKAPTEGAGLGRGAHHHLGPTCRRMVERVFSGHPWPTLPLLPFSARDRKGPGAAAVCAFSISDVKEAFDGLYKEVNRETQQWYTDVHPVPEPRPGAVSGFRCPSLFISSLFG